MLRLSIQVSPAEVIDRYLILTLKTLYFSNPAKKEQARKESEGLWSVYNSIFPVDGLADLKEQLLKCHKCIWLGEDRIRQFVKQQKFDEDYVTVARTVFAMNDMRSSLKRQIDELLGAVPGDVKEYAGGSDPC